MFLKILAIIFLGSENALSIVTNVLLMAGLWKMFEKSGLKGWWALFPGAREYQLSRCAGRESEGRGWSIAIIALTVVNVISTLTNQGESAQTVGVLDIIVVSVDVAIIIAQIVYSIRVYSGLIEVYGVSKKWMWLWVLPTDCIAALIWGFHPKYQPS